MINQDLKLVTHNGVLLQFKNYKEPISKVVDGFGYNGVILQSVDGDKLQCHICGELFGDLTLHVNRKHKISIPNYKARFGIAKKTSLISENQRNLRREKTMAWLNSLSEQEMNEYRNKLRERGKKGFASRKPGQPKESLETKNKKGTCPDQLLEKIREVSEKLNKTPTLSEFMKETGGQKYKHLVFATFGSYSNAIRILNLTPEIKVSRGGGRRYDDVELLEYLKIFVEMYGRLPTSTDCKTNEFLPSEDAYIRHFGSLVKAREVAELNDNFSPTDKEFQEKMATYSK